MKEYEKYKLKWMLGAGYDLKDFLNRIADVMLNEFDSFDDDPHYLLNKALDVFENEYGFKGSDIWACEEEWEQNEYLEGKEEI